MIHCCTSKHVHDQASKLGDLTPGCNFTALFTLANLKIQASMMLWNKNAK